MSVKSCDRIFRKEKGSKICRKPILDAMADELALRDEILELKRQVKLLKKTNEQNMVKFRKYEDEAKRKDRQIEQLMDPRKNADITKILSTKGAAILMNLKDQNNSLIQIILNKDVQIRKLLAEIKMSKLYASSRKSALYKTEIVRLRNLLIKSQDTLKENINLQQKQQEATSICLNGDPLLEMSSCSDQSSPRELEELRCTIQSLETHIKYSNDLLAKKNQEILLLSEELKTLKQIFQNQTGKITEFNETSNYIFPKLYSSRRIFVNDSVDNWKNSQGMENFSSKSYKSQIKHEPRELFEKISKISENEFLPYSAPASSLGCLPYNDNFSKYISFPNIKDTSECYNQTEQYSTFEKSSKKNHSDNLEDEKNYPSLRKSLLHDLAANEILKEKKVFIKKEEKKYKTKEKWRILWKKYKKYLQAKQKGEQNNENKNQLHKENVKQPQNENLETHEFESMEKGVLNNEKERQKIFEFQEIKYQETEKQILENKEIAADRWVESEDLPTSLDVKQDSLVLNSNGQTPVDDTNTPKSSKSDVWKQSLHSLSTNENEEVLDLNKSFEESHEMIENIKAEIRSKASCFSPEIQRELKILYENVSSYEENEIKKIKSLRETYRQSFDSSFDSEYNYSVRSLQVEAQINTVPNQSDDWKSDNTSENIEISSLKKIDIINIETNEMCNDNENDDDDDDDVIIR